MQYLYPKIEQMILPLVSIIIINYNGKHYLEKCLESLFDITYPNFEVILVDNGSTDGSVNFVKKFFPSVIIKQLDKNYGFAKPNNIGANLATGDLFLFLNNDTTVEKNFLTELVSGMNSDSNIAICQSLLLKPDHTIDSAGDFLDIYCRAYSSKKIPSQISEIFSARGASMLIKKETFRELDGFDDVFFVSFEDVDLGWRARLLGCKIVIVPKSIVYHHIGKTTKKLQPIVQFHGSKNTLILILTNFEVSLLIKNMCVLTFFSIFKRLFGISILKDSKVSYCLPKYVIILKVVLWVLRNIVYVINRRKHVNSLRVVSSKQLIEKGLITKL